MWEQLPKKKKKQASIAAVFLVVMVRMTIIVSFCIAMSECN